MDDQTTESVTRASLFQLLITQTWFIRRKTAPLWGDSLQIILYYHWLDALIGSVVFMLLIRLFLLTVAHARCGNLPNDFPLILDGKQNLSGWIPQLEYMIWCRAECGEFTLGLYNHSYIYIVLWWKQRVSSRPAISRTALIQVHHHIQKLPLPLWLQMEWL